jgi:hypothetical protein
MLEDRYDFNGHTVAVRSDSDKALRHLRWVYGRFLVTTAATEAEASCVLTVLDRISNTGELRLAGGFRDYTLYCKDFQSFDYDRYESRGNVPDPLAFVQWYVIENISLLARDCQLIHAASLAWGDDGVIFPAASGRGKTTLALGLVKRGFRFLSDELAWLNSGSVWVEPFPRRVNVSDHSLQLLGLPPEPEGRAFSREGGTREWALDATDVAPDVEIGPARLCYVVFLNGFGEAPRLRPLSGTAGIMRLFKFSIQPPSDPAATIFDFAPLLDGAQCFELVVGDVNATVDLVQALICGREQQGTTSG